MVLRVEWASLEALVNRKIGDQNKQVMTALYAFSSLNHHPNHHWKNCQCCPGHQTHTIISNPVSSQTVRNVLKRHSFKAVTKEKKPLLTTGRSAWPLL